MVESRTYEPYVIVERPAPPDSPTHTPRRWTVLRGHKPAILLVDERSPDRSGLDALLAAEGFGVYRTASRDSALDLLKTHPSVLMAVVRMDLPGMNPGTLIRELRDLHPGLWVGMRAEAGDHERANAGYRAGAVDLFHLSPDPRETVVRLIRSVPWAVRLRDAAEQERLRKESREPRSRLRQLFRKLASRGAMMSTVTVALLLGIGAALLTRSWQETRDAWNARMERILAAFEAPRSLLSPGDRQFDRWHRIEQLEVQRENRRDLRSSREEQVRDERLRDLFRSVPAPTYR